MLGNQVPPSSQKSGWREAVTGSIFGCPFTLAPPSRKLVERPLIQERGNKVRK